MLSPKNNFNSIEEAVELLNGGVMDVYFMKVSTKQIRRMHCTLSYDFIPQGYNDTRESIIANSFSSGAESRPFVVWDILMGDWRSFYLSTVTEVIESHDFGDTKKEMMDLVEEHQDDNGEIPDADQRKMVEQFSYDMQEKIKLAIENTPKAVVEFSASQIKSWAASLFSDIMKGKNIKRRLF